MRTHRSSSTSCHGSSPHSCRERLRRCLPALAPRGFQPQRPTASLIRQATLTQSRERPTRKSLSSIRRWRGGSSCTFSERNATACTAAWLAVCRSVKHALALRRLGGAPASDTDPTTFAEQYLYLDSEVWTGLKTLLWRKCSFRHDPGSLSFSLCSRGDETDELTTLTPAQTIGNICAFHTTQPSAPVLRREFLQATAFSLLLLCANYWLLYHSLHTLHVLLKNIAGPQSENDEGNFFLLSDAEKRRANVYNL